MVVAEIPVVRKAIRRAARRLPRNGANPTSRDHGANLPVSGGAGGGTYM